ncbi:hypothetical protein VPNG_00916 [Cytospora leucostoma]|uniref:N-acetylgalactosaminide beta-1,3-galactosyltransferase n=1 Tax=Cytospora leucostoma TaxID=1230097 RepID=A0A423XMQ1_9PEZI|nr:hypothetical protein VPNG_00916 [Cytospora leucostoma]
MRSDPNQHAGTSGIGGLPYDNAVRLSVRFNVHRALSLVPGPFIKERWLYEEPMFPVNWAHDVAIILKTGYGTQERVGAWFEALPAAINRESVLVVGDFDSTLKLGGKPALGSVRVHDVVAEVLEREDHPQCRAEDSCPRVEKYRTLNAAISAGEDELARNLSRRFGWELDAVKFLPALGLAHRSMPPKKWYILLDDDTYLIQPSLNTILSHFDPSTPYYIGNAVGDYRQRFAHGGSSITLSRAAMQKLFGGSSHSRHNQHNNHNHHDHDHEQRVLAEARAASAAEPQALGDRLLADALLRLGVHVEEAAGRFFNGEQPWAARLRAGRLCAPVATFHRLTAREMARAGRLFRDVAGPVLWVDLWGVFYGVPSLAAMREGEGEGGDGDGEEGAASARRGWDHVGRLDEHTVTVGGVEGAVDCLGLCEARNWCLAWTWEEGARMCHVSPWVTVGREAEGKVSGIHVGRVRSLADECR